MRRRRVRSTLLALHLAAAQGQAEIVATLLDHGFDPSAKGENGKTPLGFAHQGVMFLFETSTEWYERFQELIETVSDLGIMVDDGDDD